MTHQKSVVSGQQVGILGGPLMIIYKIIGVLKQVEAQPQKLQAIFWLETNDSDFDEIKIFHYLDTQNHLQKFTWNRPSFGISIGHITVDQELHKFIIRYLNTLPTTQHSQEISEVVLNAFALGNSLGKANQIFYEWLFSDYPIEFFNPQNHDFITFSQSYLKKELANTKVGKQANAFALIEKRRVALFKTHNGWVNRKGKKMDLTDPPIQLVPHLKTRSIIQDAYFNNQFYIAGPSEEIYLKTLSPQYQLHDVTPAKVIPRMKATLVTPKIKNTAEFTGFSTKHFTQYSSLEIKREFLNRKNICLYQFKKDLLEQKTKLFEKGLIDKYEEKIFYQKIKHFIGAKRKASYEDYPELSAIADVSQTLHPSFKDPSSGAKQERVFNILSYLNQYGKDLIHQIYQAHKFDAKVIIFLE